MYSFQELLYLYRLKLQRVVPSGPTFLTPLCSKVLESIQPITNQDQHYTFVLILTDGVCNDMEELMKTLEKHKDDPICFVVTCLGPLRIETQYYFGVSASIFYFQQIDMQTSFFAFLHLITVSVDSAIMIMNGWKTPVAVIRRAGR